MPSKTGYKLRIINSHRLKTIKPGTTIALGGMIKPGCNSPQGGTIKPGTQQSSWWNYEAWDKKETYA